MAYTQPRTLNDRGSVSLYLLRWFRSTALVVLVLLSTGVIADGQTLTFRNPRDLLVDPPAAFIELLEAARPAPVSIEDMGAILRALPPEGEVTKLGASAQQKVDAVRQLLTSTRRDWYEIKVIDLPQAAVALYARTVVLISEPALELLNAAELQAMAAHEVGHEYVWTEWDRARRDADQERLETLELVCDAIAVVTLHKIGIDPSTLIDGLETIERFNRQRFGPARNEKNYPTLAKRRAFARDIQRWLRDSSGRPRSGQQIDVRCGYRERHVLDRNVLMPSAALLEGVPARVINQDAAHQSRGDAEKMPTILPLHVFRAGQTQECLVDQRRRLQRVIPALPRHVRTREAVKLCLDERNQGVQSGGIAL